jgi:hypothetical protein
MTWFRSVGSLGISRTFLDGMLVSGRNSRTGFVMTLEVHEVDMLEIDEISKRVVETTLKITQIREESMLFFDEEFRTLFDAYGVIFESFGVDRTINFVKDGFSVTVEYDPLVKESPYYVVPTRGGGKSIGKESHVACIEFVKAFVSLGGDVVDDVKRCLVDEGLSIEAVMDDCGIPTTVCANYFDDLISGFVVIPMSKIEQVSFFAKIR